MVATASGELRDIYTITIALHAVSKNNFIKARTETRCGKVCAKMYTNA